jgi:two-component system chemotaxis sensor kinase CheA
MDLEKYRALFLEEATDHLAEMSTALLALEKSPRDVEAIDVVFRMAHSIKGMAASLDMDPVTELSHRLEDLMDRYRAAGEVDGVKGIPLLFGALDGLESMVAAVRESGAPPPCDDGLMAGLAAAVGAEPNEGESPKKT